MEIVNTLKINQAVIASKSEIELRNMIEISVRYLFKLGSLKVSYISIKRIKFQKFSSRLCLFKQQIFLKFQFKTYYG